MARTQDSKSFGSFVRYCNGHVREDAAVVEGHDAAAVLPIAFPEENAGANARIGISSRDDQVLEHNRYHRIGNVHNSPLVLAIDEGLPKLRIEEAAASKQAAIDRGRDKIIGVNLFAVEGEDDVDVLVVDQDEVQRQQLAGLASLKASRDAAAVEAALDALTSAARGGSNLLAASVAAARVRCTLGEISAALETVFTRFQPADRRVSGVFSRAMEGSEAYDNVRALSDAFAARAGRRPRILVAKMGQDGHDRGAKVVASSFADLGFDVDLGPLFSTPAEVARQAVENDVHVVGVSTLAAGHLTLVPGLLEAMREAGRPDILVVAGGVIPPGDHEALYNHGVVGVFGPGTPITTSANDILELLLKAYD